MDTPSTPPPPPILPPFPELDWVPLDSRHRDHEALLGTPRDGVRFSLSVYPTCFRRGPYRLLIDVLPGPNHHKWGCFDAADQPLRWYHRLENVRSEAQAIALVLWEGRYLRRGETPPEPTAANLGPEDAGPCLTSAELITIALGHGHHDDDNPHVNSAAHHLAACVECRARVAVYARVLTSAGGTYHDELKAEEVEDQEDLRAAREGLADVAAHGSVPWEQVKADAGIDLDPLADPSPALPEGEGNGVEKT
jgi:hypothetical protein